MGTPQQRTRPGRERVPRKPDCPIITRCRADCWGLTGIVINTDCMVLRIQSPSPRCRRWSVVGDRCVPSKRSDDKVRDLTATLGQIGEARLFLMAALLVSDELRDLSEG